MLDRKNKKEKETNRRELSRLRNRKPMRRNRKGLPRKLVKRKCIEVQKRRLSMLRKKW
jgi:hypothetical protein